VKKQFEAPQVTSRTERIYDINRDGLLQQDEIQEFYRDIIASIDRRGEFKVRSGLLKVFDTNEDGKISRYEAKAIETQLN